jgi:hypothetical protein
MGMPLRQTIALQNTATKPPRMPKRIAVPNALAAISERAKTDPFSWDVCVKLGCTPPWPRPEEGEAMTPEQRDAETVKLLSKR